MSPGCQDMYRIGLITKREQEVSVPSNTTQQAASISDDQIDQLRALPARYYVDQDILKREKERLFFKTWQYACHISELDEPGAYVAAEILGQNVFVVRDEDGSIRAFYNVCPHRGHKLVEGTGNKRVIVCPYHQWSYSLDGQLRYHRKTSSTQSPAASMICLHPVRVDTLLDFVFFNLDPGALPMSEFYPGLQQHVLDTCPDVTSYSLNTSASVIHPVEAASNWKLQVDNFLECYHCSIGHKSFSDMLDVCNQKQTLHENYTYVHIPSSGKADNLAYPLDPDYDVMDLHFWFLFPNLGLGQFSGPGNLSLFQWLPVGMDHAFRVSVSLEPLQPTDPGMMQRRELRAKWGREVLQPEDISFMESAIRACPSAVLNTAGIWSTPAARKFQKSWSGIFTSCT